MALTKASVVALLVVCLSVSDTESCSCVPPIFTQDKYCNADFGKAFLSQVAYPSVETLSKLLQEFYLTNLRIE